MWWLSYSSLLSTCTGWRGTLSKTALPLFWDLALTVIRCCLYHCLVPSRKGKGAGLVLQVLRKWRLLWRIPDSGSPVKAEAESTGLCFS